MLTSIPISILLTSSQVKPPPTLTPRPANALNTLLKGKSNFNNTLKEQRKEEDNQIVNER